MPPALTPAPLGLGRCRRCRESQAGYPEGRGNLGADAAQREGGHNRRRSQSVNDENSRLSEDISCHDISPFPDCEYPCTATGHAGLGSGSMRHRKASCGELLTATNLHESWNWFCFCRVADMFQVLSQNVASLVVSTKKISVRGRPC